MLKVSVIIGVYNGKNGLTDAINSIRNQTYDDWECIICDDGSTDGTWDILKSITNGDVRFVLVRHETNKGLATALNTCIRLAKGEYLARQDTDDLSINTRLEEQVIFLDRYKDVTVVGTYSELFDSDEKSWGFLKVPECPRSTDWVKGSSVVHASTMMRKRDILSVGGYDERPSRARVEDYDLWIRLIVNEYRITTLPKMLYRIHWDISDYARKKSLYRWNELKVKRMALKIRGVPLYYYAYLLKPVISAMVPSKLMHLYHLLRFRNVSIR